MYENIIALHSVLKKKNYIVKFSTSSIFKKISKDKFERKKLKKKETKRRRRDQFWVKKTKKDM